MKFKKLFINSILFVLTLSFHGCNNIITNGDDDWNSNKPTIHGSGRLITISKDFTGFNKVNLSHSFKADVFKSDVYTVTIKVDDNLLQYLEAGKSGDKMYLGLNNDYDYNDVELIAEIGVPDVAVIDLSGASAVEFYGFDFTHSLDINLSGASYVNGVIRTGDLKLYMSGASYVNLTGEASSLSIFGSGASNVELPNFPVTNADINLSGASYCKVNVSINLMVHLSGASILYYTGNPTLSEISADGVSKIIKY